MLTVLSPGQGAQAPGMLSPWLELPGCRDRLGRWSDVVQLDLVAAGTTWSAEAVRDTAVAQPLLTALALVSGRALLEDRLPDVLCGHSVGELPALALAGVLTDDDSVALARGRGRAMARAAAGAATGMAAVLGGSEGDVAAAAARYGLALATVNVPGQIVLGGPVDALRALAAEPPPGARVRPLDVAGAFHTDAMASATDEFARLLRGVHAREPAVRVVANADGALVRDAADVLDRLLRQLTRPVRFDLCLQTLARLGVTEVVELAPGGTLSALVKRALPDARTVALHTPADLPAARSMLAERVAV